MSWQELTPSLGSLIEYQSVANSHEWQSELRSQVVEHGVVFLRGFEHAVEQLQQLASILGEPVPDPHPVTTASQGSEFVTTLRNDADHPPVLNHWHSDASFCEAPPRFSLLSCRLLPSHGGDTIWLSTAAAFAALPDSLKEQCRDMKALHRLPAAALSAYGVDTNIDKLERRLHPLIISQGGTRIPCLFANRLYTNAIIDESGQTHRHLLVKVLRALENPDWQYRHRWQIGDIAIWDNQCTQHYAVADYFPQTREMWRLSIDAEKPEAAYPKD